MRIKNVLWILYLIVFCSAGFAYYDPVSYAAFASTKPYSFSTIPGARHYCEENFAFAFEIAAGEYLVLDLFPWPRIQGYYQTKYKKLGISFSLIDRYQHTIRSETHFTDLHGNELGVGYFWDSRIIYALRAGVSYPLDKNIIMGVGSDLNYGVYKFDIDAPPGLEEDELHIKQSGFAPSYGIGLTILSREKQLVSIGYDSHVKIDLNETSGNYLIPHQFQVSLGVPIGQADVIMSYTRRFGGFRGFDDSLRTIACNDFGIILSFPIGKFANLHSSFYTLPFTYHDASKAFGFSLGTEFEGFGLLDEVLLIYERGSAHSNEVPDWEWRMTRYGIRLAFSW